METAWLSGWTGFLHSRARLLTAQTASSYLPPFVGWAPGRPGAMVVRLPVPCPSVSTQEVPGALSFQLRHLEGTSTAEPPSDRPRTHPVMPCHHTAWLSRVAF